MRRMQIKRRWMCVCVCVCLSEEGREYSAHAFCGI